MISDTLRIVCTAVSGAAVLLGAPSGGAQTYPSKPVRLVVPYAPGGATDIIARAAAAELTKTLAQPVVVENRPGAGGNVGAELVAKSAPDGYTMVMSASSLHGITPFLYSKLNYDPNKDLVPVIVFASFANVLRIATALGADAAFEQLFALPPYASIDEALARPAVTARKRAPRRR